jgi:hypothetical protein
VTEHISGKYLETITWMNESWRVMQQGYYTGDTRVKYLRRFELALNANMQKSTLWHNPRYASVNRIYPLPRDAEYVSEDKYRAYIWLYTEIMRDEGLLNKSVESVSEEGDDIFR